MIFLRNHYQYTRACMQFTTRWAQERFHDSDIYIKDLYIFIASAIFAILNLMKRMCKINGMQG